jgi:hypothetical protein
LLFGVRASVSLVGPELADRHHDNLRCTHVGSIRPNEASCIQIYSAIAPAEIQVEMWQG